MKKIIFIISIAILYLVLPGKAQIGDLDGIYYQAVALDDDPEEIVGMDVEAKPLYKREIGVIFTITKGLDGTIQWEESHVTTTDKYGLFTLTIGKGDVSSTAYTRLLDIPWIEADQFLKVEISTKNDGNYKMVSNQKFMSVPYAFYSDDIADSAITSIKIYDETILAKDINTGAVETSEILDETILAEDIKTGAVETSEILNETIINEDIATGAVESSEILNETILAEDINTGAVETSEILDETILAEDIKTGAVETSEILNETILAEDIKTGAVTTDELLDGTIQNIDIKDSTINLQTKVTDTLGVANGGTGLDASAVADGQLMIGDGTEGNFKLANITAGEGIEITESAGAITIASPLITTGTNSDGTFSKPVGTIPANGAWKSGSDFKIDPIDGKPFAMGDLFLVSANVDLQDCILSAYLENIGGDGRATVKVVIFNPWGTDKNLTSPGENVIFKFLLVK